MNTNNHARWLQRDPVRSVKSTGETLGDWIHFHNHDLAEKSFGVHLINQVGLNNIIHPGGKVFIEVHPQILLDDGIFMWSREHLVLCLTETFTTSPEIIDRLKDLRSKSFVIGVKIKNIHDQIDLLKISKIVIIDASDDNHRDIENTVMALKKLPFTLLFMNVNSKESWILANRSKAQWIHGHYFHEEASAKNEAQPRHDTYIKLLTALRNELPVNEMEPLFKMDVMMTSQLFFFLGTAGSGYAHMKIDTIKKALISIGYKPLYRWLSTTWFSFSSSLNPVIQEQSLFRARICELLGKNDNLPQSEQDTLFLVGLFSNIHLLLGVSMEKCMSFNYFPESVLHALQNPDSRYGVYLHDAIRCEMTLPKECKKLDERPKHTGVELTASMLEALSWTRRLRGFTSSSH